MRLGGWFRATTIDDLEPLCEHLDTHSLSAIPGPPGMAEMDDDACAAFGERARELDLVVGEFGYWENLLTPDLDLQAARVERLRTLLRKADLMDCGSVVTLVGTKDPSDKATAPHPYLFTDACQDEFHDLVRRVLDGLELRRTSWLIEPWFTSFFYRPHAIRRFLDRVDHPAFALHLDQMNLVDWDSFYRTGELIDETFDLLADKVRSVHLKDIRWDWRHQGLKWDEVAIGDGVMDYPRYLTRLAELPEDMPCYCEHFPEERDYALSFARLHHLAERAGVPFRRRAPVPAGAPVA
jgi:sugar phosphate isomerase/epimerase